jgi:hypothetical protein
MKAYKNRIVYAQHMRLKMKDVYLKIDEKSSKIASKNSNSNLNFRVFESKNGVKVNNKTIIFKTNYNEIGFDRKTKRVINSKENGAKAAANISYIDREKANEREENEELSNTYDLEKKLEKDELNKIKEELKNGVVAFRRDVISLDFDDELSTKEQLEIIRESYKNFHDDTNKNPKILISLHTNTEHKHAHVLVFGEKEDVKINKVQLQSFKVEIATQTANKLENKGLENTLENFIKREEKRLETAQKYSNFRDKTIEIQKEFNEKTAEKFKEFSKDLSFSKQEIDVINEKQKATGYKDFVTKSEKLTDEERVEKLAKAEKWISKIDEKIDDNLTEKIEKLKEKVEVFKESEEFKNLNKEFKLEQNFENKDNLKVDLKELKEISFDKSLQIKQEEIEDKTLTLEQQIDKKIDGKLDNKQYVFQK